MTNIKALDKLREVVRCGEAHAFSSSKAYYDALGGCIAEIEHEVSERFVELPVDSDGVPIRPDDLMACTAFDTYDFDGKEHVLAVGSGFWVDKHGCTHIPSETRHVKPRKLEKVLEEFGDAYVVLSRKENPAYGDGLLHACDMISKYADEIREVLGVEE